MKIAETIAGGSKIKRAITGRFILCKDATGAIVISGRGLEEVHIDSGENYDLGELFTNKEIYIANTLAGNNAFDIEVTQNKLSRPNQNDLTVNTVATIENGDDNTHLPRVTIPAGASAVLAVANGSRKYLRISLSSNEVGPITLGKGGVSAAAGGLLEEGQTDYMETSGVLYAFNNNAAPVDVYVMEVNKL